MSGHLVHVAAQPMRAGDVIRQRCAWCGALLTEVDLANVAVAGVADAASEFLKPDGSPSLRWEGLVAVATGRELEDGRRGSAAMWAVPDPEDGRIPADSCMALPPEATA